MSQAEAPGSDGHSAAGDGIAGYRRYMEELCARGNFDAMHECLESMTASVAEAVVKLECSGKGTPLTPLVDLVPRDGRCRALVVYCMGVTPRALFTRVAQCCAMPDDAGIDQLTYALGFIAPEMVTEVFLQHDADGQTLWNICHAHRSRGCLCEILKATGFRVPANLPPARYPTATCPRAPVCLPPVPGSVQPSGKWCT